jgi:Holliday junction DNA helicase RuvA
VIGFLRGRVLQSAPDHVLLDVSGVGYSVHIPVSTYAAIERARPGEPIELFIRTHVREDALDLYGFATEPEKRVFEALIGISGIGPRLAQVILSGMGWEDLLNALAAADVARLVRIPGVGKKTSERMVVELRDSSSRMLQELRREPSPAAAGAAAAPDLVSALVNLGYRQADAEKAAAAARQEAGASAAFADVLRASLKKLSRA